jgi:hypothetical protein
MPQRHGDGCHRDTEMDATETRSQEEKDFLFVQLCAFVEDPLRLCGRVLCGLCGDALVT